MTYPKEPPPWGQNIDSGVDDEIDDQFKRDNEDEEIDELNPHGYNEVGDY